MKFSFYTGLVAAASLATELQAISLDAVESEALADSSSFDDKSLLLAPTTEALEIAQTGSAVDAEAGRRREKSAWEKAQDEAKRNVSKAQKGAERAGRNI